MTAAAIRLRNECDDLCRQLVRRRIMCERCQAARGTDTAHLIRRTFARTRVELNNLVLLCRSCHTDIDSSPEMLEAFAIDRLGETEWDSLHELAEVSGPVGEHFWEKHRNHLRALL